MPKKLDKGTAVKRLKTRLCADKVLCAGDSVMDISMLEIADVSIAPRKLGLMRENLYLMENELFAAEMLEIVKNIIFTANT